MKNKLKKYFYYFTFEKYPNLYRPSSKPYISGDTFRNVSNHIFDESKSFNPKDVKNRDIIFLKTDLIEIYFKIQHPQIESPYFLITHNSDRNVTEDLVNLKDEKIIHWFAQNLFCDDINNCSILPIGLENKRWIRSSTNKYKNNIEFNKSEYVLGSFKLHNNFKERNKVITNIDSNKLVNFENFENNKIYLNELKKYMFVLCPSGNGVDTHRIWESLIFKTFPILLLNSFSKNLIKLGVPGIYLENWSELNYFSKTDFEERYSHLSNYDLSFLKISFWENLFS